MNKYRSEMSKNSMADVGEAASKLAQNQNNFIIRVEDVFKIFQTPTQANLNDLEKITLDVSSDEFVTIIGPNGCGKSTLLKLIANFSPISTGRILFQNNEIRGLNTRIDY